MQGQTYSLERTIEHPNFKARIFRPNLTAEEKKKRMQNIYNAASNLLKEINRVEKRNERNYQKENNPQSN